MPEDRLEKTAIFVNLDYVKQVCPYADVVDAAVAAKRYVTGYSVVQPACAYAQTGAFDVARLQSAGFQVKFSEQPDIALTSDAMALTNQEEHPTMFAFVSAAPNLIDVAKAVAQIRGMFVIMGESPGITSELLLAANEFTSLSAIVCGHAEARMSELLRRLPPKQRAYYEGKESNHSSLSVFLCHASGDKPAIRALYERLLRDGFQPWFDEVNLLPGQDWREEIVRAVRSCHVVLVCLSLASTTKEGFVQRKIKYALDVAGEKPEGTIFMIPVRLDDCVVPIRLRRWQWVNLFEDTGYSRVVEALRTRHQSLTLAGWDGM